MNELNILLVEDNPDDEFLTLRTLAKLNQKRVQVAHEGIEALQYLFGDATNHQNAPVLNKPDLILLDMKMPLVDGLEFLEACHANLRTHDIPVIIVSSSRLERDVLRAAELGARSYITKPVNAGELANAFAGVFPQFSLN
jgi:CheY-like chemotaxis protein